MDIPDCYDPIYQAEHLVEEPTLHCENCGQPIYEDYFWEICGDLLCEDCAARIYRKNVEDLL